MIFNTDNTRTKCIKGLFFIVLSYALFILIETLYSMFKSLCAMFKYILIFSKPIPTLYKFL